MNLSVVSKSHRCVSGLFLKIQTGQKILIPTELRLGGAILVKCINFTIQ